ncbi:hypothetical protein DPMN_049241 [Dreissena polymorpha]|uniref:Uncharacterized protein n=1 Tax=Dreissena polymorpha TaxID=45954 RepID=A0A9D4CE17_DREPO|nr:hypothetical protein DPMN_049241 [Dreissena polymorpha]
MASSVSSSSFPSLGCPPCLLSGMNLVIRYSPLFKAHFHSQQRFRLEQHTYSHTLRQYWTAQTSSLSQQIYWNGKQMFYYTGTDLILANNGGYRLMMSHNGGNRLMMSHNGGYRLMMSHNGSYQLIMSHNGDYRFMMSHNGGYRLMMSHNGGNRLMMSHNGGYRLMMSHNGSYRLMMSHNGVIG